MLLEECGTLYVPWKLQLIVHAKSVYTMFRTKAAVGSLVLETLGSLCLIRNSLWSLHSDTFYCSQIFMTP